MKNLLISVKKDCIIILSHNKNFSNRWIMKIYDFNLKDTFECGQCFRWEEQENGAYIGVVGAYVIEISGKDCEFEIKNCEDTEFIEKYFDLKRDYGAIKRQLCADDIMKTAVANGGGIRILMQDPWEALVSFIISANNNIPRIKKIIGKLCENFGDKIEYNGKIYYTFPTAERISKLSLSDIEVIKSGFRDKYILDAAKKVASGEIDLSKVFEMNTPCAREYLKNIKGVGNKVADCVLLFAYGKFDAFPKDVWIKRLLFELYNVEEKEIDVFVNERFGEFSGFAQQYLFYYGRG